MLKNFLKEYFSYSRKERNGIILLLAIVFIIIIAYLLLPLININQEFNLEKYESKLDDFKNSLENVSKQKSYETKTKTDINNNDEHQLFMFNPNTANVNDLRKLGFKEKVIRNIIKYRNKGGYFQRKIDLLKIYSIDTFLYYRLVNFIYLNHNDSTDTYGEESSCSTVNKNNGLFNINKADTHLISELFGTEDLISERIIKYRNLLGGFVNKKQFDEIYGLRSEQHNLITNNVFIDTTLIRRININKTDERTLDKHPYLNKYYAKAIIKYRDFKGEIKSINELSANNILPENIFFRIRPYLSVD
jgi:competence protein ComEA